MVMTGSTVSTIKATETCCACVWDTACGVCATVEETMGTTVEEAGPFDVPNVFNPAGDMLVARNSDANAAASLLHLRF